MFRIVFVRLGNIFLIVALLAATGTHWALLQSVAWTTMLAGNLRTGSFSEAVQKTFDGKHPCNLCKEIKTGQRSEKKPKFSYSLHKLEFVTERVAFVFDSPPEFILSPEANFF